MKSFGIKEKAIIFGGTGIAILVLVTVVFVATRQSAPAFCNIQSYFSNGVPTISFEVTNSTSSTFVVYAVSVEMREAGVWEECHHQPQSGPELMYMLSPSAWKSSFLRLNDNPKRVPLRLRLSTYKEIWEFKGVFQRFKLQLDCHRKGMSFHNPFKDFSEKPAVVTSEQFFLKDYDPKSDTKGSKEL